MVSARRDSKYLANFITGFLTHRADKKTMLYVMVNKNDTWNADLIDWFDETNGIRFFGEDYGYGRAGLHIYFNKLYHYTHDPDWLIYFCEDHQFILPGWDKVVLDKIKELELDPEKPYCLIPKFDNVGAMNQILSRGYIKALGGVLGYHGNIDSYINDVNRSLGGLVERKAVIRFDEEMFHDYTHDKPIPVENPVYPAPNADKLPKYNDHRVLEQIAKDSKKIKEAWGAKD